VKKKNALFLKIKQLCLIFGVLGKNREIFYVHLSSNLMSINRV
jgi:hypothetical protein